MRCALRQGLTALACIAGLLVLLMITTLTSSLRAVKATQYELLCEAAGPSDATVPYHMIFFLDVNACLTCNEDMNAWRELVTYLREHDLGTVTVFSPKADSADVEWAMHLEGICDSVKVLEQEKIEALGWTGLGIPVKLLLDSRCRPIEIMNWLGTAQQSREFVQRVIDHIETTSGKR